MSEYLPSWIIPYRDRAEQAHSRGSRLARKQKDDHWMRNTRLRVFERGIRL
jgi:hypothetical protein